MASAMKFDVRQLNIRTELLRKVSEKKKINALDAIGSFVASESKDNAPIDEGFLTEDIETQVYPNDSIVVIRVPINSPSSSYAVKMHEGDYNLGPRSSAKQSSIGKRIGKKYITRAINDSLNTIKDIAKKEMAL